MKTTAILLAVFAAALTAGCDETTRNVFAEAGVTLVESRADAIAHPVTDNWNEPTMMAINAVKARHIRELRAFRCRDGAGIVMWREGGGYKGFLFLAFYDTEGAIGPAVEMTGDFVDTGAIPFNQVRIVWTPTGDAVIAFVARQSEDPSDGDDDESDRVYFTSFRRAFAELPFGPNGETWGFNAWARAVDTNITDEDDNQVNLLFAATNLVDGTIHYSSRYWDVEEETDLETLGTRPSGTAGDANCIGTPFVYLGWIHRNADGRWRLEGGLVHLDTLQFSNADVAAVPTEPAIEPSEIINDELVITCGRDIAFTWRDNFGESSQHRLNLVRVNQARTGLEPTIDVSRGTQTHGSSEIVGYELYGDGYRILNGQNTTWIVMQQDGYVDGTVTQEDDDVVFAQINAMGEVQIGEYDSNPPDAAEWNSVIDGNVQLCRGATRLWVYYRQPTIENANVSLFARAIRLDGNRDLTENVSNAERINSVVGTGEEVPYPVEDFFLADVDPFCSPQTNNDVSCVVYRQIMSDNQQPNGLLAGNGPDGFEVVYARVAIADINASPPMISSQEWTIFANLDGEDENNWRLDPVLVPSSVPSGHCLVFLAVNGNHRSDGGDKDHFDEPRPFLFAVELPGGQATDEPVEIGSNNPSGPTLGFANFATLDLEEFGRYSDNLMAEATPTAPADRDCAFDNDLLTPNFAHTVFFEFVRSRPPSDDAPPGYQTIWRGRAIDLQVDSFPDAGSRIFPPLREPPSAIGTGNNAATGYATKGPYFHGTSQGDNVLVVFNEVWGSDAEPGFIYVNTFDPALRRWSRAALLSNDFPGPIGNRGDDPELILVPGVQAGACDRIVDGWVFWFRTPALPDGGELDVDLLQGRRFHDLNLPE